VNYIYDVGIGHMDISSPEAGILNIRILDSIRHLLFGTVQAQYPIQMNYSLRMHKGINRVIGTGLVHADAKAERIHNMKKKR
jgi:hypothetical protein